MLDYMEKRHLGRHYIRQWREYRGYSLRSLANMMEREPGGELITSHANLGRIEKGQQPYSEEILEALAHALQCSVTDLLTVNPLVDSEVVDLMALLKRKDPDTVRAILSGLPDRPTGTEGS